MKKVYCFWLLSLAVSLAIVSCDRKEIVQAGGQLENSFSYGDAVLPIESVVYSMEEDGRYVFYFSPTGNLVDPDAMKLADDYIAITAASPEGNVDLMDEGNLLVYRDVTVSSSAAGDVSSSSLVLNLTSSKTVMMSLDVTMASGQTLRAEYKGICSKWPADPEEYDVVLDKAIYSYYFGQSSGTETHNYYFTFTDAEYTTGTGSNGSPTYELQSEGYVFILDMFTDIGQRWKELPGGIYSESSSYEDHTYTVDYSAAFHFDSKGTRTQLLLTGPLTVETDDSGETTISGTFFEDGAERTVVFKGTLDIVNGTYSASMPQIGHDVEVEGHYAEAVYDGNMLATNTGLMLINIQDYTYANTESHEGGYSMTLAVFNRLFADSFPEIVPGTYVVGDGPVGTWLTGSELNWMGMAVPFGTYVMYDDGTDLGQYSYCSTGEITIEAVAEGYKIDFEFESFDGYTVKGSYTGPISVTDESDDGADDDGTSSLEENYEMDLSYIPQAYLYTPSTIYIPAYGYGDTPVSSLGRGIALQMIDIGFATGTPVGVGSDGETVYSYDGDVLRMELLVEEGTERTVTPGIYTVTTTRYPDEFDPMDCVRGYSHTNGFLGTRWLKLREVTGSKWVDENGNGVVDPGEVKQDWPLGVSTTEEYACAYSGSVSISESDKGEGWYKFDFNFYCVREHNFSGTWEGPLYFGGTTDPVPVSGTRAASLTSEDALRSIPAEELASCYLARERMPVRQKFN